MWTADERRRMLTMLRVWSDKGAGVAHSQLRQSFADYMVAEVRAKYAHGQGESVDKVNVGRDAAAAAIAFAAGVGAGATAYEQTVFDATSAGAMIDALTHGNSGGNNGTAATNGSFSSVAASTADEYPCFFDAHDAHFNSFAPPAVFANGAAAAAAAADVRAALQTLPPLTAGNAATLAALHEVRRSDENR